MPITPDTKDWTWVLRQQCPECGVDVQEFRRDKISSLIRTSGSEWSAVLERADVGSRPSDDVWSPLEYACHVRDVFDLYDERLQMMLNEEDPLYPNWDQDSTAIEKRYGEQDPAVVSQEVLGSAGRLAERFDTVQDDQWSRKGRRSDGAEFTIETFARYLIHDPLHHLHDVGVDIGRIRESGR